MKKLLLVFCFLSFNASATVSTESSDLLIVIKNNVNTLLVSKQKTTSKIEKYRKTKIAKRTMLLLQIYINTLDDTHALNDTPLNFTPSKEAAGVGSKLAEKYIDKNKKMEDFLEGYIKGLTNEVGIILTEEELVNIRKVKTAEEFKTINKNILIKYRATLKTTTAPISLKKNSQPSSTPQAQ